MRVEPATPVDLVTIRAAYANGRALQREQGSVMWPEFSDAFLLAEIDAGRLFRVMDDDVMAGVFNVAYDDAAIWAELERGSHVYLHRIARAPQYAGRGLMEAVLGWAEARCRELGRAGLRMDTWASNAALIAEYGRLGFKHLGSRRMPADPRLSPHYHGIELALLERSAADVVQPVRDRAAPQQHDRDNRS